MTRNELTDALAQKWTDDMDFDSLQDFFYSHQVDYLSELNESELINLANENEFAIKNLTAA